MKVLRAGEERGRDQQRRGRRLSAHDLPVDRVLVDRLIEGRSNANVLERILPLDVRVAEFVPKLVHAEENRADFGSGQDLGPRIGVDAGLIVERNWVHPVDLAREKRRDAGRGVGDRREDDFVDIGLRLVPPVRVPPPDGLHPRLVADQDEGPGAVGVKPGVGRRLSVHRGRFGRAVGLRPALGEHAPAFPLVDQAAGPASSE